MTVDQIQSLKYNPMPVGTVVTKKTDKKRGKVVGAPAEPTGEGTEVWKVKVGTKNEHLCRNEFDIVEVTKLQKQPKKAQHKQEKQLKAPRRGASAASGGAPSKHRRLVQTSTPAGEGDAHTSEKLGCAAAPQLQPSSTAAKQDGKQADDLDQGQDVD